MQLPRTTPEAQGIPSSAVAAFLDAADALDAIHSCMLLRHGAVVAEGWWSPYRRDDPHMLFSLSKSFTSTAAGFAIDEGLLSADDPVLDFFADHAPAEPSEHLRAMRVRHLLSMSTGHTTDTLWPCVNSPDGHWAKAFLNCPVEREPGTHFLYNSGATYMVSAIVQQLTGQRIVDYLGPRLFEPLGIPAPLWETCPRGINTGGWGLSLRTEDIARFGLLYLNDGVWDGERILPEGWVAEATRQQIDNSADRSGDWAQGYGYQFWRCQHGCYRGDGAFGQFCVVLPEADAVVAMTSGIGDLQGVLDLVWEHLLPAMGDAPLPADSGSEALAEQLANLTLNPPSGAASSPVGEKVQGRVFTFEDNDLKWDSVVFERDGSVTLTVAGETRRLAVGQDGVWCRNEGPAKRSMFDPAAIVAVAACGAWPAAETYELYLYDYNTPFRRTVTCRFEGDTVEVNQRLNVAFGPTEVAPITGRVRGA